MALTPSNTLSNQYKAPAFSLYDTVSGTPLHLNDLKGSKGSCILFICNHCPFVKLIQEELVSVANSFQSQGIPFIAISSNDVERYPEDAPEKMKETAALYGYPFPYLYDETQEVAKAYDAACTPDIYVFDADLTLYYHGQLDDARPGNGIAPNGKDLRNALQGLIDGKSAPIDQKPSIGCGIKWKTA